MPDCKYHDPYCPCQDGDACHYEDCGDTKAMDPRYVLAAKIADLTARLAEAEARLVALREAVGETIKNASPFGNAGWLKGQMQAALDKSAE